MWSPDSRKIAFIAEGKLKKIDLAGGSPNLIAEVGPLRGADWNRSGVILLARTSDNVIVANIRFRWSDNSGYQAGHFTSGSASGLTRVSSRRKSFPVRLRGR